MSFQKYVKKKVAYIQNNWKYSHCMSVYRYQLIGCRDYTIWCRNELKKCDTYSLTILNEEFSTIFIKVNQQRYYDTTLYQISCIKYWKLSLVKSKCVFKIGISAHRIFCEKWSQIKLFFFLTPRPRWARELKSTIIVN